jgi:Beta-ketoacyl synthase, N-terminal domain
VIAPVYVSGVGFWAPGYPDARAWASGKESAVAGEPPAVLLAASLRRRASALTRMIAEVATQAAEQAAVDLARVPLVMGSALGELRCATDIIASFRDEGGLPSPTKFHNSVHNTAVGYLSMATGNRLGATAVAAGPDTVAVALIEAAMLVQERGGAALLLLADEEVPAALQRFGTYGSAAVAFCLSAEPTPRTRTRLEGLRRDRARPPILPGRWQGHPCSGGLALAAAIENRQPGPLTLGEASDVGWVVDLTVVER